MAENESLDLGRTQRWLKVLRALRKGRSRDEIVAIAEASLRKTIRRLQKQITLDRLVDAAVGNGRVIDEIVRESEGHDYAVLFRDTTVMAPDRECAMRRFLGAIPERFFDQMVLELVPSEHWPQIGGLRAFLEEVRGQLQPEVVRLARKLAVDPNARIVKRRSRASNAQEGGSRDDAVLGESLLGPKR